jgi:hypothetical protein
MPSVVAQWSGRCADRAIQHSLCEKMEEIARLSHSYFADPPLIKYFDTVIEGRILIAPRLTQGLATCPEARWVSTPQLYDAQEIRDVLKKKPARKKNGRRNEARRGLLSLLEPEEDEPPADAAAEEGQAEDVLRHTYPVDPLSKIEGGEDGQDTKPRLSSGLLARAVHLFGLEFRLYDWRNLYGDNDRLSFVFASVVDCPELTGVLVYVEDRAECQYYRNSLIRSADWFLTQPRIHLRYYCEDWMDQLLAYVKRFYLPDLWYWRYQELAGYDYHAEVFGRFYAVTAREEVLSLLKANFTREVDEWERRRLEYKQKKSPRPDDTSGQEKKSDE